MRRRSATGSSSRMDARVKTIHEILVGADVLKMMGWEDSLGAKVAAVRQEEFGSISKAARLKIDQSSDVFFLLSLDRFVGDFWHHMAQGYSIHPSGGLHEHSVF